MLAPAHIAVVGGGLTGLTAAIRLAEQGIRCELFEAAPSAGGRTRSFYEPVMQQWCDNGPHLLIGAYQAAKKLFADCGISSVHWQSTLSLPLWDEQRGHFHFQPTPFLPFPLAMLHASSSMPGHGLGSGLAMLRMALALQKKDAPEQADVVGWLQQLNIPEALIRDMLEPLCLGAMNESMQGSCSASFKRVLQESFATRENACLGWFTAPMQEALIDPLIRRAESLGVIMHTRHRVRSIQPHTNRVDVDDQLFDRAILALPAYATDRLLGRAADCTTRPITNVHMWITNDLTLPDKLVGCIGGTGHWYFDVTQQCGSESTRNSRHICAVISADSASMPASLLTERCLNELAQICKTATRPELIHSRIVREQRATVLVSLEASVAMPSPLLIDASERPSAGQLPATIESAVRRGENAAFSCISKGEVTPYPL